MSTWTFSNGVRSLVCFGRDVGLVEPPVLVPTDVLRVENVLVVVLPDEIADASIFVSGDRPVIVLAEGSNPYIQHTIHRSQISQLCPVGWNLGIRALRIPKQHVSRNQLGCELLLGEKSPREDAQHEQTPSYAIQQSHSDLHLQRNIIVAQTRMWKAELPKNPTVLPGDLADHGVEAGVGDPCAF